MARTQPSTALLVVILLSSLGIPLLYTSEATTTYLLVALLDDSHQDTYEMIPGQEYRIGIEIANTYTEDVEEIQVSLSGAADVPQLDNHLEISWTSSAGFHEPSGQGAILPLESSAPGAGITGGTWWFVFNLPEMSRAGIWEIRAQCLPQDKIGSRAARVGFAYQIGGIQEVAFTSKPAQTIHGSPTPLQITVDTNDNAALYLSSTGLIDGGAAQIDPSKIIVDDDPNHGEQPEQGNEPLQLDSIPSLYTTIGPGIGQTLNIYTRLDTPFPVPDSSFGGSISIAVTPTNMPEDISPPTITALSLRSTGHQSLVGPTDSVVASATVTDDSWIASLIFTVSLDGAEHSRKQVQWSGNGNYEVTYDLSAQPDQTVHLQIQAVDTVGNQVSAEKTQTVRIPYPMIGGLWVGSLSIWENDYFDDIYDIYPSFPSDGWTTILANVTDVPAVTLHYERRFTHYPHIFESGSITMSPVSTPICQTMWQSRIQVAPSENLTYWVETSEGETSAKKWFKALPDVWNDHYGYGLLASWGESWSPATTLTRLAEVGGSFVIPITTWGQSSTNPPRYMYPFADSEGLWDPEFGGYMSYTGFYNDWVTETTQNDPCGEFYANSWFFYHRTWRNDPVPAPHTAEQWDRMIQKLGRIIATDPTWRALVVDQEYGGAGAMQYNTPLNETWDDDHDGDLRGNEFEVHMVFDILKGLREYRSDTWYGGQPHLGYVWGNHDIPTEGRLAASVNHFQHCDASGGTGSYFTGKFDRAVTEPVLSAGVSACASDLATDYTLHTTTENHGTPTTWSTMGYAEQLLYAYLLNPHYVTNWVHGGWSDMPSPAGTANAFDIEERQFTQTLAEKWNHLPYLSNLVYTVLPTGGDYPLSSRELGQKPSWLNAQPSSLYYSISKETGSMWQMAVANFDQATDQLTIQLGSSIFDEYASDTLVSIDPTDPSASWTYITRQSNTLTIPVQGQGMAVRKIGLPIEILSLPQIEDGYQPNLFYPTSITYQGYDSSTNKVHLSLNSAIPQFAKLYLPPGGAGSLEINGAEPVSYTLNGDLANKANTDDLRSLVSHISANSNPGEDTSPPVVELAELEDGGYLPKGIECQIQVTATDHPVFGTLGVSYTELFIDGSRHGLKYEDPYVFYYTPDGEEGSHIAMRAEAVDKYGNRGTSETIDLTIIQDYAESTDWFNIRGGTTYFGLVDDAVYGHYSVVGSRNSVSKTQCGIGHSGSNLLPVDSSAYILFWYKSSHNLEILLKEVPPSYDPIYHGTTVASDTYPASDVWSLASFNLSELDATERSLVNALIWSVGYVSEATICLDGVSFGTAVTEESAATVFLEHPKNGSVISPDSKVRLHVYGSVYTLYSWNGEPTRTLPLGGLVSPPPGALGETELSLYTHDPVRGYIETTFVFTVDPIIELVVSWILSQQKPDLLFGPSSREYSGLYWTRHAIEALAALDELDRLQNPDLVGEAIRNMQPTDGSSWGDGRRMPEEAIWDGTTALAVLGLDSDHATAIKTYANSRQGPDGKYDYINSAFFYDAPSSCSYYVLESLHNIGVSPDMSSSLANTLRNHQNPDGGYDEGFEPRQSNLALTWQHLRMLDILGSPIYDVEETIGWIESCQNIDGGYGYKTGSTSDMWYTYSAVASLSLLGAEIPQNVKDYVAQCANWDGGYGDKPGWPSRLETTNLAVMIAKLAEATLPRATQEPLMKEFPEDLGVFTGAFAAGGYTFGGHPDSPGAVVQNAHEVGVNLLGLKASQSIGVWLSQAQQYAADHGLDDFTVVTGREEYPSDYYIPGLGSANHIDNWVAYNSGGYMETDWDTFRTSRILGQVVSKGGVEFAEFLHPKEFTYISLDDSVAIGGYNCHILDSGLPYIEKYEAVHPLVVEYDAHKDFWETNPSDFLNQRFVYLARNSTWRGFLEALDNGWLAVVNVVRDTWYQYSIPTRIDYYGSFELITYLQFRSREWIWWDPQQGLWPSGVLIHPITATNSYDQQYKLSADTSTLSSSSAIIRIWTANRDSLFGLSIDGVSRSLTHVPLTEQDWDGHSEYDYWQGQLSPGVHTAKVTYYSMYFNQELEQSVVFEVP